jgi:hypothetical protein
MPHTALNERLAQWGSSISFVPNPAIPPNAATPTIANASSAPLLPSGAAPPTSLHLHSRPFLSRDRQIPRRCAPVGTPVPHELALRFPSLCAFAGIASRSPLLRTRSAAQFWVPSRLLGYCRWPTPVRRRLPALHVAGSSHGKTKSSYSCICPTLATWTGLSFIQVRHCTTGNMRYTSDFFLEFLQVIIL